MSHHSLPRGAVTASGNATATVTAPVPFTPAQFRVLTALCAPMLTWSGPRAVARIRWTESAAEVQAVGVDADDPVLVAEITASDKAGIDCPLGWPRRFVEFVAQHQAGGFVAPADVAGRDWRRQLALRQTVYRARNPD
jgi:hypothetical protein